VDLTQRSHSAQSQRKSEIPAFERYRMVKPAGADARFVIASDQSLFVYFDPPMEEGRAEARHLQSQITLHAHEQVRKLLRLLEVEPVAGIRNLHPGYASVLVVFDGVRLRHEEVEEILREYLARMDAVELPEARLVEIPVCYGGEFGPDLEDVAGMHGLSAAQAIEMHSSTTYLVYFLGFVPGFAYLGELPEGLVTPRLAAPRRQVPKGSVGIAGNQTGVYPFATPGGWRLLGRTPISMVRTEQEELSLLAIGDRVRFAPISAERFAMLERVWG
jgi:KipI family sensor histidine kinase inhibitor